MTAPRYHIDGDRVIFHDEPRRPSRVKRLFVGVLAIVTLLVAGLIAFGSRTSEAGDSWSLEPDKPRVVDLGDGYQLRTMCAGPGVRVFLSTPTRSGNSGVGVSLTVPGGVAAVADKECL